MMNYAKNSTELKKNVMRIGIDARPLHWPGIGRCIRELVAHLSKVDKTNQYVVYFSSEADLHGIKVDNPNFRRYA
jgi:hypothetical protein